MKRSWVFGMVVVALASTTMGCRKLIRQGLGLDAGTSSHSAFGNPTPQWAGKKLTFQGAPGEVTFSFTNFDYAAWGYKLPAGTILEMGGESFTFGGSDSHTLSIRSTETLAKVSPSDALDYKFEVDPKQKVSITFPGGTKQTFDAPKAPIKFGVVAQFKNAKNVPLKFAGETPPKEHTILYTGSSEQVIGPAATLAEVDWVAYDDRVPSKVTKVCSGYKKSGANGGGPEKSYNLESFDSEVTIMDRATMKEIDKKTFTATGNCPMMAFSGKATSYASTDDIIKWLRARRAK